MPRHGRMHRLHRVARAISYAACVAMMTVAVAACSDGSASDIVVQREVPLIGVSGQPNAVAQMANGGFVVAGVWGNAWAVATPGDGKVSWTYNEPPDPNIRLYQPSIFSGVATLPNGDILLCGNKVTSKGGFGLVVILDTSGRLVEERLLVPKHDQSFFFSRFDQCVRWNNGVVLIGTASDDRHYSPLKNFGWIVKLNGTGQMEWEQVISAVPGVGSAAPMTGQSLLVMGSSGTDVWRMGPDLTRIGPDGVMLSRRHWENIRVSLPIRPVQSTAGTHVIIRPPQSEQYTLYTLRQDLQDAAPPRTGTMSIFPTCGYALPDGSLALFGTVFYGLNGIYVATVARLTASGRTHYRRLQTPGTSAASVSDATPIGPNQFVTVRGETGQQGPRVLLSWITFK